MESEVTAPDDLEFITAPDLPKFGIHLSKSSLLRLEKAGTFPRRQYYSPRKYYWTAAEIRAYLARNRIARPTVPPKDALTAALDHNHAHSGERHAETV